MPLQHQNVITNSTASSFDFVASCVSFAHNRGAMSVLSVRNLGTSPHNSSTCFSHSHLLHQWVAEYVRSDVLVCSCQSSRALWLCENIACQCFINLSRAGVWNCSPTLLRVWLKQPISKTKGYIILFVCIATLFTDERSRIPHCKKNACLKQPKEWLVLFQWVLLLGIHVPLPGTCMS